MTQGNGKAASKKSAAKIVVVKSKGSQKHKARTAKSHSLTKGKRQVQLKPDHLHRHSADSATIIAKETTKAINRKNERIIAAKAVSVVGNQFFLSDLAKQGQQFNQKQTAERNKKEQKKHRRYRLANAAAAAAT